MDSVAEAGFGRRSGRDRGPVTEHRLEERREVLGERVLVTAAEVRGRAVGPPPARRLGLVSGERVSLTPALGRRHPRYRRAEIVVRHREDGTSSLSSKAEHVFSGTLAE